MLWVRLTLFASLATLFILAVSSRVDGASVRDGKEKREPHGPARRVFMPASDASNFLRRRGRRSIKSHAEYQAEQRVRMRADEFRRENNEENRNEFENYVEEERDEQHERTREKNEQWRQYNYDGRYPRFYWSY